MDIPRTRPTRRKKYLIPLATLLFLGGGLWLFLFSMDPPSPGVERQRVRVGRVEHGTMVHQVTGYGMLTPLDVRWITASSAGRVDMVHAWPGMAVEPGTKLLTLANPQLVRQLEQAELDYQVALADQEALAAEATAGIRNQEAVVAAAESEAEDAALTAQAEAELFQAGLISQIQTHLSQSRATRRAQLAKSEAHRLAALNQAEASKQAAQKARVDRIAGDIRLLRGQVTDLVVRADMTGVVRDLSLEVGRRVAPGDVMARVADPTRLKAELQIQESEAGRLRAGQKVEVTAGEARVDGTLSRVSPDVEDGVVKVEVRLADTPQGARMDMSVRGVVEIERIENTVFLPRPAFLQGGDQLSLFRLEPDQRHAERVTVQLGRASAFSVEILEGLAAGDQVILSDLPRLAEAERIEFK